MISAIGFMYARDMVTKLKEDHNSVYVTCKAGTPAPETTSSADKMAHYVDFEGCDVTEVRIWSKQPEACRPKVIPTQYGYVVSRPLEYCNFSYKTEFREKVYRLGEYKLGE